MVITDDRASDRLLTASSMTAMELETKPTNALNAASSTFAAIPTALVLTIIFSLSAARTAISSDLSDIRSPPGSNKIT